MRSDPNKAGWGLKAATWAGVLFLHIPLALIILYAFSAEDKSYVFPPPGLTTQWFAAAWAREDVWAAIGLSFRVALIATGIAMKPEIRLAQWLMASVFLVMGGYRLWQALHGVPTSNMTLGFSVAELVLGIAIAAGWRLRGMALLAALLMLVDAAMSHKFWVLRGAEQGGQLLHFMKNIGFAGGLLLLASVATGKRR